MTQGVVLHGQRGRRFEGPRLLFLANQALAVALAGWFLLGNGYAARTKKLIPFLYRSHRLPEPRVSIMGR
jgi:hypothetical protein